MDSRVAVLLVAERMAKSSMRDGIANCSHDLDSIWSCYDRSQRVVAENNAELKSQTSIYKFSSSRQLINMGLSISLKNSALEQ